MLKKTLDKLQKLEVIAPVDGPTEWVNSLVMPEKRGWITASLPRSKRLE
jgi:ribonuclease PH